MSKDIKINASGKLDSFRWETLYDNVEVINEAFDTKLFLISSDSGEVVDDNFKQTSYKHDQDGIKTHYIIRERYDFRKKITVKYLQILINAKLLRKQYFEGITQDTIVDVYSSLMNQLIVSFDYETFLNGSLTDIDVCKDFYKKTKHFKDLISQTKKTVLEFTNVPIKTFNRNNNLGFQISIREAQNPEKQPFVKWYSKIVELQSHSEAFYMAFFKDYIERELGKYIDQYKEYRRIEVTIKNTKHLKALTGTKSNKLRDILKLDFDSIITDVLKVYLDTQTTLHMKTKAEGKDKIIQLLLNKMFADGNNLLDISDYIGRNFNDRTKKKRAKDLVLKLGKQKIQNIEEYQGESATLIVELTVGQFPTLM